MSTRWMLASLGAQEDAVNQSLAGTGVRFCYHPDRTLTSRPDGTMAECDYCPAWALVRSGIPDMTPLLIPDNSG